jgi:hypothetical protein
MTILCTWWINQGRRKATPLDLSNSILIPCHLPEGMPMARLENFYLQKFEGRNLIFYGTPMNKLTQVSQRNFPKLRIAVRVIQISVAQTFRFGIMEIASYWPLGRLRPFLFEQLSSLI